MSSQSDNPELRALVDIVHNAARELNHAINALPDASVDLAAIAELNRFGTLTELANHIERANRVVRDAAAMQRILDKMRAGLILTHQLGSRGEGYYIGEGIPERMDKRPAAEESAVNRLIREGYINEAPPAQGGFRPMIIVYQLASAPLSP